MVKFKVAVQILNAVQLRLASMENAVHHVSAVHSPFAMLLIIKPHVNVPSGMEVILIMPVAHHQIRAIQILAELVPFANWIGEIQSVIVQRV